MWKRRIGQNGIKFAPEERQNNNKTRGELMAVMRIQSLKVSNLRGALRHRLSPPKYESLIAKGVVVDDSAEEFKEIFSEFGFLCEKELKRLEEFFRIVESKGYKHKIRKNATVQEVLISYSAEDFAQELGVVQKIKEDVGKFVEVFKEKFGFEPFAEYFIHKDDKGRYHVHLLFSLMKPDLSKKVRWNSKTYFEIVKKFSKRATRVKFSEHKKSGVYPLWLVRELEKLVGRNDAKEVIRVARKRGLKAVDLVDLVKRVRVKRDYLKEFLCKGKVCGVENNKENKEKRGLSGAFERKAQKPTQEEVQEQGKQLEEITRVLTEVFGKKRKSRQQL